MFKTRPIFLTGVCLYLLLYGCYGLFTSFAYLKDPQTQATMDQIDFPNVLQVIMLYLDIIVALVSGAYMFQEANWARWLYLGWGFVNIDYHLYIATDWHQNILPIAGYLVCALILVVPSANRYFSSVIEYTDAYID